jgi:hypothetical protein
VPSSSSMLSRTIWNYMSATDSSQTSRTLHCEPVSWLQSLWGRSLPRTPNPAPHHLHQQVSHSSALKSWQTPCPPLSLEQQTSISGCVKLSDSSIKLQCKVNKTIIPGLGLNLGKATISENCARHWLKRLGYGLATVGRGIYVGGHE